MAFKMVAAAALCALSACTLVSKLQTGNAGPSASGPTSGPSSSGASSPSTPKLPVASTGGGSGYCGAKHYAKHTAKDLHSWWDETDEDKGRYALHFVVK